MVRPFIRFVPIALVFVIVAALVWRLANPPDSNVRSRLVGQPVPEFVAPAALAGSSGVATADLAEGKPKLVNFFASCCVPCIAEAPVLMELRRRGVPIVGIAVRDRPEDVARFLAANGNPFGAIGADPQSRIQLAFGSAGVPETFLVDGKGVVRMQHIGPIEPGEVAGIVRQVEESR
jgi:cytochrome c biogenesis protein CcmG/thiol:disulfide interchange protein DsbE